jgi:hypothetical protein
MELYTEIEIQATADRVWQHLTNLDDFHLWNPFILSAQGIVRLGEKIQIHIKPPQGKDLNFQTTIIQVEPDRNLTWRGKLIIPGLFDSVHSFTIDQIDNNSVHFSQREKFSGLIVPLLAKDLNTKVLHGLELMNQALKVRAESSELMDRAFVVNSVEDRYGH